MSIDSVGSGGGATFRMTDLGRELQIGDKLTPEEAQFIADNSEGRLEFKDGILKGKNDWDDTGDVYIDISKGIPEDLIHDLHHAVLSSGGIGNSNGNGENPAPLPLNGGSNAARTMSGHSSH